MLGSPSVPPLLQYTGRISAGENEMQYLPMAAKRYAIIDNHFGPAW